MRKIYEGAKEVVVWLGDGTEYGDGTEHSELAFELIDQLSAVGAPSILQTLTDPTCFKKWDAMFKLLARPYWARVWIVQELVSNDEVDATTVLCGRDSCKMKSLMAIAKEVARLTTTFPSVLHHEYPGLLRDFNLTVSKRRPMEEHHLRYTISKKAWESRDILQAANDFRDQLASNPRDKIYGFWGLVKPYGDSELEVNYNLTVGEVFTSAAKYIIEGTRKLSFICAGQIRETSHGLPSWVPDWSRGHEYVNFRSHILENRWRASGDRDADVYFTQSSQSTTPEGPVSRPTITNLHAKGYYISTVRETVLNVTFENMRGLYAIFRECFHMALRYQKSHESREERLNTFWRTMILGCCFHGREIGHIGPMFNNLCHKIHCGVDEHLHLDPETTWKGPKIEDEYTALLVEILAVRRFFGCERGFIGMGPLAVEKGDVVCVLLGCDFPVILRRVDDHFILLGEAYLNGYMNGEGLLNVETGDALFFEIR